MAQQDRTEAFLQAVALFNQHRFFECHEVLEDLWRPLPPGAEKQFLQGLLQVAVGFHHWQNGNDVGTRNKLREGLEKLVQVSRQTDYSPPVDCAALIRAIHPLLAEMLAQPAPTLPVFAPTTPPQLSENPIKSTRR